MVLEPNQLKTWLTELKEYRDISAASTDLENIIDTLKRTAEQMVADTALNDHVVREALADIRLEQFMVSLAQLRGISVDLQEAKRLLKLSIADANSEPTESICAFCKHNDLVDGCPYADICEDDNHYVWRYTDEVLKLLGSDTE